MSTTFLVQLLYAALALVMVGLGLSLTLHDFRRVRHQRRAVVVALALQMVALPLIALSLTHLLDLSAPLAVGMMLLAATPGSISANLYSHLFGGDVALNVTLTGLNTFLCALTLPLICAWAIAGFVGTSDAVIPVPVAKAAEVLAIVCLPIVAGMFLRSRWPRSAEKLAKPVKIGSAVIVIVFSVVAIVKEWEALAQGFAVVGTSILLLNIAGLALGYTGARTAGLPRRAMITVAFQVSIHNALLALYVALVVLENPLIALPAAVYSITMNLCALAFGFWVRRGRAKGRLAAEPMAARQLDARSP